MATITKTRPAETATATAGMLVGAATMLFHWNPEQAGTAAVAVGFVATAVTYVVAHGGLKGVWHSIFSGSS